MAALTACPSYPHTNTHRVPLYFTLEGCRIILLNGYIKRNEDQRLSALGGRKGKAERRGNRGCTFVLYFERHEKLLTIFDTFN